VAACQALRASAPEDGDSARQGPPLTFEGVLDGTAKAGYAVTSVVVDGVIAMLQALLLPRDREDDWRR
jgi:hypothetical protein